ncbi:hypothetical protein SUGI_0695920 [Cryptomeria japonica]|nr:hypothetical protein SUGI_0695920 [Cryptomeria japonica]
MSMFEREVEELAGQAEAWKYTFAFVESLAVKSVVLLGIPDIIARHGPKATLSLSQIAAELPSEKPDLNCLFRILRLLVAKNFFRAETSEGAVEVRYGLTSVSKWFVKDGGAAPSVSMTVMLLMRKWSDRRRDRQGPSNYKRHQLRSPPRHSYVSHFPGVKHVGGDMFKEVPSKDAVFMKWVLHDWRDEDCVNILKQCRKAIPKKGKVIIVDAILNAREKTGLDPSLGIVFDLLMIVFSSGGKERSEEEWKNLLMEAGFPRFNFIAIPALQSVIEAFPH